MEQRHRRKIGPEHLAQQNKTLDKTFPEILAIV